MARIPEILPQDIAKLRNLRHLILLPFVKIRGGIGELVHLQTLGIVVQFLVQKSTSSEGEWLCNLSELGNLSRLGGGLRIGDLDSSVTGEDARAAKLSHKPNLRSLSFFWRGEPNGGEEAAALVVLDNLRPHTNLEELRIWDYPGVKFPEWLGHPSFNRLTFVLLLRCFNCEELLALGRLPSLKVLKIHHARELKRVGLEPQDAFPSLEELMLQRVSALEGFGFEECRFPRNGHSKHT